MGDFNTDWQDSSLKSEYVADVGNKLEQIVDKPTRVKTVNHDSGPKTSSTIIDLIFLSDDLKARLKAGPNIIKNVPSDHLMLECFFDVGAPSKWVDQTYFLDPTRRPPIPSHKLPTVIGELSSKFETEMIEIAGMDHDEIVSYTQKSIKESLDRHNPMNSSQEFKKRIYVKPQSEDLRNARFFRNLLFNRYRKAKRQKASEEIFAVKWDAYRVSRNFVTKMKREESYQFHKNFVQKAIDEGKNIWQSIKKFQPSKRVDTSRSTIQINGKSGVDLANHMANFIAGRAKLVSTTQVSEHSEFIPYPTDKIINIEGHDRENSSDVGEKVKTVHTLFKPKKKANLAAGPDTISHRHILDLMPAIEPVLTAAIEKPINKFPDISRNFNRLISKEAVTINKKLTEKSQRPIAELDLIPKYSSIRLFIDDLKKELIPKMNNNQFSFPGKGTPMAIVKILDTFAMHAANGKKSLLAIYDFSNAFCTLIHPVVLKIASSYGISEQSMKLLEQFMEQSHSSIKMSDKNGYYMSDEIHTGVGNQQGQIGSDFIFSVANDATEPEIICE